ncbi:unnamed protein product [Didymodactylos carnosus]|uniref:Uncharacterized protein n=1 Tax=Didymodactylos carnosus TaxID=1234261 RepID=A0A814U9L9_9BILA|nr:unnamed protein product [Didymodactylos carnosus]CAF3935635.1 unnamed protein product [Didymodactylos carnosus]
MDPFTILKMAFEQRNRTLSNSNDDDVDSIDRRKVARYREKVNVEYDNPCLTRTDDSPLLMMEENSCSETGHEDVTEGEGRRDFKPNENHLTIMLHQDAIPVLSTKHTSFYVISGTLLEIPPPLRDYAKNKLLLCIVHSCKDPDLNMLLEDLVKTLVSLKTNGLMVEYEGDEYRFNIRLQLNKADLPCRTIPETRRVYYPYSPIEAPPRTHAGFVECARIADRRLLETKRLSSVNGVKGTSPLLRLYSNVQEHAVYDYMHLCSIYGQYNQLFSLHAVKYLPNQIDNHSALFASGCFADESFLGCLKKLRTSTRRIAYNIFSQYLMTHSMDEENNEALSVEDIFVKQKLDQSTLINRETLAKFTPHFKMSFEQRTNKTFSNLPVFARYRRGLTQFHSLIYQRLKIRISFVVSIKNDNCMYTKKCYASVILYFEYNNVMYAFVKMFRCGDENFRTNRNGVMGDEVHDFLDKYYDLVDLTQSSYEIISVNEIKMCNNAIPT